MMKLFVVLCFLCCLFSFVVAVVRLKRCFELQETYRFIANHPFIFVIHEKRTDLTLFVGRFTKPTTVSVHHTEL
jgi:serine protease inhibitor